MGSSGKTRTTFAKLNRESKLREKRAEKEARKTARRFDAAGAAGDTGQMSDVLGTDSSDPDALGPDGPEEVSGMVASDARADGI